MAAAAEEALIKIGTVLPEDARRRAEAVQIHAFQMPELDDATRAGLDRIEAAVETRHRLVLSYAGAAERRSERPVRPLGFWFWGKV